MALILLLNIAEWFKTKLADPLTDAVFVSITTLVVVFLLVTIIRKFLSKFISKNSFIIGADPTKYVFLKNSISFILYTIGVIFIIYKTPYFGSLGSALFAGAGVFAAVIGFASQKAFSNIISGIFILVFKPFSVGDTIEISNAKKGIVESITLRHTIIRDYEMRRVIIPNNVISEETIVNSSFADKRIKKHIVFNIAYNANVNLAKEIIIEKATSHSNYIDGRTSEEKANGVPEVNVRLIKLDDHSIKLKAYVWTLGNDEAFVLQCELLEDVKNEFDKQGIEIPFPYQNIIIKNDKTITIDEEREVT